MKLLNKTKSVSLPWFLEAKAKCIKVHSFNYF